MKRRRFDCFVIGDVILDTFFRNGVNSPLPRGGTSYCDLAKIEFGGAGNVAAGMSVLGGKACFVGKAGDDLWGRQYDADLRARGVTTKMWLEKKASTGVALVTLYGKGERSFCVFRGANDKLSVEEVGRSVGLLKSSMYLYFSGYSLFSDPQRQAILHAVRLAKTHGVEVFFDPGAYNLVKSNFELFDGLLDACNVFCPNVDEAKAIVKKKNLGAAIEELQKRGKLTAVKCGASGCILIDEGKCVKIPGFEVNCVDTTGAGDAFSAAFIYGLVRGLPPYSIGQLANWFAARVTARIGPRSFPTGKEVLRFLDNRRVS